MPPKKQVRFSDSNIIINESRKNLRDITNNPSIPSIPIIDDCKDNIEVRHKNGPFPSDSTCISLVQGIIDGENQSQIISGLKKWENGTKLQTLDSQKDWTSISMEHHGRSPESRNNSLKSKSRQSPLPINDHLPDHFNVIFEEMDRT
jgi:hypothetical protein